MVCTESKWGAILHSGKLVYEYYGQCVFSKTHYQLIFANSFSPPFSLQIFSNPIWPSSIYSCFCFAPIWPSIKSYYFVSSFKTTFQPSCFCILHQIPHCAPHLFKHLPVGNIDMMICLSNLLTRFYCVGNVSLALVRS